MQLRSVICTVLGHVDHGKSSLLDKIRGTSIVSKEAGAITQAIGASIIPIDVIKKICGKLLDSLKIRITIPGLLFIDTPGHEAFTNLRKRGSSLADIAILVVDINEGIKPQTIEAIEILKNSKTPFLVAANKVDLIAGWKEQKKFLIDNINAQPLEIQKKLDTKLYEIVTQLFDKFAFNAERFDRVEDYTKKIAIVPCSAKTGEGIPELLMLMAGLAQRYLEECLKCDVKHPAKGTVLEVKEERGLGTTLDVIIYDGTLKVDDTIVIGDINEPIVAKVRALFEPMPLNEMRDKKAKYKSIKEVYAATGVKISAPGLKNAIAGMPLRAVGSESLETVKKQIQDEVEEVLVQVDKKGIILKADSLGALEAIAMLLRTKGFSVKKAFIGNITKKDISDAESSMEKDPLNAVILGFNVALDKDVPQASNIKIILGDVIYRIIGEFEKFVEDERKKQEARELEKIVLPCKMMIMRGYVFRQNNPAIAGVEILAGSIKTSTKIINEAGKVIATLKSMQQEKESVSVAKKGQQLAMALDGLTIGRQANEGDIIFSSIPEDDFRVLKKLKQYLKKEELDIMKEIAGIKRKTNPTWGI